LQNLFISVVMLMVLLVSSTGNTQATPQTSLDPKALVYVTIDSPDDLNRFTSTHLPMYTQLDSGLLTGANFKDQLLLKDASLDFQVLDADVRTGTYFLAENRTSLPAPDFASYGLSLLNTSNGALLRMDPSQVDALTQAGAELKQISLTPKPLPSARSDIIAPDTVDPDPLIQGMIDQVTTEQVYQYEGELAGELQVWVDGAWYTINTRHTNSGTPIQKTIHYVGQHMANDLGLDVEYHVWNNDNNPNVIGEIPGLINPDDIFIIGAHIDDVLYNGQPVPGADDNASGSVATLLAADILSHYQWGCTLRFAFWTGEEQGLNGSHAYAQRSYNNEENILGYLNLDMIAWNTPNSPASIFLGYLPSVPPSLDLANLFSDVVYAYNLNLQPLIGTSYAGSSDHSSFLDYGYPAILAIEGIDDFNPYYHTPNDKPANTNLSYFTDFVKASIGTYAHMSDCLNPSGLGTLDGHVTEYTWGTPLVGATVLVVNGQGHTYPATTDDSGYYTRTLLADTYTVTVSAYGYLPATIDEVEVFTDKLTTLDFPFLQRLEQFFLTLVFNEQ
jgi:hypothetical protein